MLKEVFRTVPIPYWRKGEETKYVDYNFGAIYTPNIPPWVESMAGVNGIFVGLNSVPTSPTSIYVFTQLALAWWPSWGNGYYRFDGVSGQCIRKMFVPSSVSNLLTIINVRQSRLNKLYALHFYGDIVYHIGLGKTAQQDLGDDTNDDGSAKTEDYWVVIPEGADPGGGFTTASGGYPISRFGPYNEAGSKLYGWGSGGSFAIDDSATDTYLDGSDFNLRVFQWSTGKFKYEIIFPDYITEICLEDTSRAYILLGYTRTVVLFDYVRNEILGMVRIPPLFRDVQGQGWNNSSIRLGWDPYFKRLLTMENTPNNPDGTSSVVVRGFRTVPVATRITVPIPLKVPRQRRIVPVLVQVVGDRNEGVGAYTLEAKVSGSGSLVGIPISDHYGNTRLQVACEGSPLFSPDYLDSNPSTDYQDWMYTGSPDATPPHAGLAVIKVSATLYQPDPPDIPVTGVPGPIPGPAPAPGPPGGGSTPAPGGPLVDEAPNYKYVLDQVFSSRPWKVNNGNEYDQTMADGRGGFTEAAVTAMHDLNANFGHFRKTGGNMYNGHAVDAICFLNSDGTTAETIDIMGSDGHGNNVPTWQYQARTTGNRPLWYYPA